MFIISICFFILSVIARTYAISTKAALSPQHLQRRQSTPMNPDAGHYCDGSQKITGQTTGYITSYWKAVTANVQPSYWTLPPVDVQYRNQMNCKWQIVADKGNIISLEFEFFHTECGWDFVDIYDGPDTQSRQLGHLCGNRGKQLGFSDVVTSSNNSITVVFTSDVAITTTGFIAMFKSRLKCASTAQIVAGTSALEGCASVEATAEEIFVNFLFTPREFHSAAYAPAQDTMYITFGESDIRGQPPLNDMFAYHVATNTWEQITNKINAPAGRLYHSTWVTDDGNLIMYGGLYPNGNSNNDLWRFRPDIKSWERIVVRSDKNDKKNLPPGNLIWAATELVRNGGSPMIYVVGGFTIDATRGTREAYVFDLVAGVWTQLPSAPVKTYGASLIYHPATNTLHLIGGYRFDLGDPTLGYASYIYSIDAGLWYIGAWQSYSTMNIWNRGEYIGDDVGVVTGGLRPLLVQDDIDMECFTETVRVVDLACNKIGYKELSFPLRRKGHSMVVTNNGTLLLAGGSNGFNLNDIISVPLSSLQPTTSRADRDACAVQQWCELYYDCTDCLARKFCGWCGNRCVYVGGGPATVPVAGNATCPSPVSKNIAECPLRLPLKLSSPETNTVSSGGYVDYKASIDAPDRDLLFTVSPQTSSAHLNLTIISIRPIGDVSSVTGTLVLLASDYRCVPGDYVIRVSYPAPANQRRQVTQPPDVQFTLQVATRVPQETGSGTGSSGFRIDSQDITTFVVIFVSSVLLSMSATYLLRRMRERLRLLRLVREGEIPIMPKEPPKIYEVELEMTGMPARETLLRSRARARGSGDTVGSIPHRKAAIDDAEGKMDPEGLELHNLREEQILRTAHMDDEEHKGESKTPRRGGGGRSGTTSIIQYVSSTQSLIQRAHA
ncbi:hypothetical protein SpCBS45565_g06067 [Spizellomyces sp. 'palustris']|nr:hypothetical protein SpCBS45565_g06067 [Spizellomyces sp. 'palustris']